jgi:hypothetical protein
MDRRSMHAGRRAFSLDPNSERKQRTASKLGTVGPHVWPSLNRWLSVRDKPHRRDPTDNACVADFARSTTLLVPTRVVLSAALLAATKPHSNAQPRARRPTRGIRFVAVPLGPGDGTARPGTPGSVLIRSPEARGTLACAEVERFSRVRIEPGLCPRKRRRRQRHRCAISYGDPCEGGIYVLRHVRSYGKAKP